MGFFNNGSSGNGANVGPPILAPLPEMISIPHLNGAFIARASETLIMREKLLSFSQDDFSVKTVAGQDVLHVHGETFTMTGRAHVKDLRGNVLFDVRRQLVNLGPENFYAEDTAGRRFMSIKGKWSFGGAKSEATFMSSNGQVEKETKLALKGDFFAHHVDIVDVSTQLTVATLDRQWFNAAQIVGGNETYTVTVAPGMDMTVIVAMCIALDERRNNR